MKTGKVKAKITVEDCYQGVVEINSIDSNGIKFNPVDVTTCYDNQSVPEGEQSLKWDDDFWKFDSIEPMGLGVTIENCFVGTGILKSINSEGIVLDSVRGEVDDPISFSNLESDDGMPLKWSDNFWCIDAVMSADAVKNDKYHKYPDYEEQFVGDSDQNGIDITD